MKLYCIENALNGKKYVGFTSRDVESRVNEHFHQAKYEYYNSKLYRAINKYGKENFKFYELYSGDDALEKEHGFVLLLGDYNVVDGGGLPPSRKGAKLSEATKAKISASKKGQQPWLGRKHSEESKRKISENYNTSGNAGKRHSEEAKKKMSERKRGKILSTEHKQKIREAVLKTKRQQKSGE